MKTIKLFLIALALLPITFSSKGQGSQNDLYICRLLKVSKTALTEGETKVIQKHASYLDSLGNAGILVFAGRTKLDPTHPSNFGLILLRVGTKEQVEKIMKNDPAYKASIHQWEFFPFSMGIRYFKNLE